MALHFYKKKRLTVGKFIAVFFCGTILIFGACAGNLWLKGATNGKPVEKYIIDEVTGKNALEFALAQEQIEKESVKRENELLRNPSTISRGNIDREQFFKEKVIGVLNKYLSGALSCKGDVFYDAGKNQNVNPMLMVAISIHETANGTSKVLKTCNNVAGINWSGDKSIPHNGRYRVFKSIDESIYNLAYILKYNYIEQGRTDIASIGDKFCPLDDPDNGKYGMVNESWVPTITKLYCKILDDVKEAR